MSPFLRLAAGGVNPITSLDRQIAAAKRKGERTEIMEGLKRFLESPRKQNFESGANGQRRNGTSTFLKSV